MTKYEKVHEQISAWTVSRDGDIRIKAFQWKDRIYQVLRNNLTTKARKGTVLVYLFSVSNDSGAYKLRFDTDTLRWWLEEILWEE